MDTAAGVRNVGGLATDSGNVEHHRRLDDVPERNEASQQNSRDQDDHGGINKLFVFLEPLDFRIGLPWPAGLAEFAFYFTDESGCFCEHGV